RPCRSRPGTCPVVRLPFRRDWRRTHIVTGLALSSIVFAPASLKRRSKSMSQRSLVMNSRPALLKLPPPLYLAAWISGYYHAKLNNRILDLQAFEENMNKVQNYCYDEKNFKVRAWGRKSPSIIGAADDPAPASPSPRRGPQQLAQGRRKSLP